MHLWSGLMACLNVGGTEMVTSTGYTPSAGSYVTYKLNCSVAGTVSFSVNGGPPVTLTGTSSANMAAGISSYTSSTAAFTVSLDYFSLSISGLGR